MVRAKDIPDAWDDDDWVETANRAAKEEPAPSPQVALPRNERLARHVETQRRLWEDAYVIMDEFLGISAIEVGETLTPHIGRNLGKSIT